MMHLINDRYNAPMFDVENGIGLIEKREKTEFVMIQQELNTIENI